jgi:DNA-binding LacI/PurR family transcriptional regulator
VVTGWLDAAYHLQILRAIRRGAREQELNLVTFITSVPDDVGASNVAHLIDAEVLGGLIFFTSGRDSMRNLDHEAFARGLRDVPVCGVAMDLPGASRVLIDNESGVQDIVRHLIRHHGARRFAYITGPDGNEEAAVRYRAFEETLDEYGLGVDPMCVVQGDYRMPSGNQAVHTLVEERGVLVEHIDAIVTANDGLARGCIDALAARGIRVPWQVAVVGFDDGITAQQSPVPLTTVHQPLYRAGEQAIRLLVGQMRGEPREDIVLPTSLVIRHSCGCLEGMGRLQLSEEDLRRRSGRGFEVALLERRDQIFKEVRRVTRDRIAGLARGWEMRFVGSLVDELKGRSEDGFRVEIEDILDQVIEHRGAPSVFHDVVSVLWRHLIPCVMADPALRTAVEGLLDGARLAISAATQRVQAGEIEATEILAERVGETCVAVAAADSVQALAGVVQKRFPQLGIRRLSIAVFARGVVSDTIHQVLWFEDGPVLIENVRMSTSALPGSVIAPGPAAEVLVMPLHARGAVFGIVCLEVRPLRPFVFMTIRDALSAVIDRLRLVEQV